MFYGITFKDEKKKEEVQKYLKIGSITNEMSVADFLYQIIQERKGEKNGWRNK